MAPLPVICLFVFTALVEFAIVFVPLSEVLAIIAIFAGTPVMVIAITGIVVRHARGATDNCRRCHDGCCQEQRTKPVFGNFQFEILPWEECARDAPPQ